MTNSTTSQKSWVFCKTGSELNEWLPKLTKGNNLIALDIETTGLEVFDGDEIVLVQLGTPELQVLIDIKALGNDTQLLKRFLASEHFGKLGHNLAFDCGFLEAKGFPVRGPLYDTFLLSKVLTAGLPERQGMNSLDACLERHINVKFENKKELQLSWVGLVGEPTSEMIEYAANDVRHLHALFKQQTVELLGCNQLQVGQLECRALPALVQMYVNGMKLDIPYYEQLLQDEKACREEKKLEVIQYLDKESVLESYKVDGELLIHPKTIGKGKDRRKGFNLGSPTQLGPVLHAVGVPLPKKTSEKTGKVSYSCDKNVLAFFLADFEVLRLYKEFKVAATACSYIEKLINIAKKSPDGRIHARYNQMVRTGRLSSSQPNLQQVCAGKKHRKGFIAEANHLLAVCDYSQLELRLVTFVSQDKNLLKIYNEGIDVHTASASLMTGLPIDQISKEARSASKVFNFSCLYGAGPKTVRRQAVSQFGMMWSEEEVKEKLGRWKSAYPGVVEWQTLQGNSEDSEVRTAFGRRRLLPKPEDGQSNYTVNLNTPIQGLGADLLKVALATLWEKYLVVNPDIKLIACVHDELILEAPKGRIEEAKQMLQECMEGAAPLIGIDSVPIIAEPSSGPDWSEK